MKDNKPDKQYLSGKWSVAIQKELAIAVDAFITPELLEECLLREFTHSINTFRKDEGLRIEDRIILNVDTDSAELQTMILKNLEEIKTEILAEDIYIYMLDYDLKYKPLKIDKRIDCMIGWKHAK